jgi:hypothetical protein
LNHFKELRTKFFKTKIPTLFNGRKNMKPAFLKKQNNKKDKKLLFYTKSKNFQICSLKNNIISHPKTPNKKSSLIN